MPFARLSKNLFEYLPVSLIAAMIFLASRVGGDLNKSVRAAEAIFRYAAASRLRTSYLVFEMVTVLMQS